jgi:hypothetical protein
MNDDDERLRKKMHLRLMRAAPGLTGWSATPVAVGRSSRILVFWLVPGVIEVRS